MHKAVSPPGTGDQFFTFNLPGAGQCIGTATLTENQTFDCVVPTGTYEVTEQDPAPNFALDQITCDDTDSTGDVGTRTATYVIDPAETVTCTFTNVDQRGHIVIEKAVSPPGAGDQFFTFNLPGAGQCIGTATLIENQTFDCVVPTGTYEVTEQDPAPNFALDQITCDDTDSTGDVGTRTATYVIDPAETVTCTFTNVDQRGHIVIEKAVSPPGAGDQFFTFNLPGAGQCIGTATLIENQTFDCVVPTGTYEVTEQDPAPNFALDQITCDDTDSTGDVGTRTATYVIDPAETVTCTFTNVDQRGHIVIEKAVSPPGAGDQFFTFNLPGAGQCIGTATLVENQTFDCVVPTGTYEVTEQDPAPNFALDQITCDDTDSTGDVGTRTATYVIDPAETVTCTFTNVDQRGHIVIEKAVSPPGAGDQFFTFNLPGAGQCIGTATLTENQTFDCVVPTGTYEVTEQDPAPNFALDQITCDDTDSTGDVGTRTATYVIDPAETVTCTFTNVDQRGHIVIEKAVSPPGAGDQFFTFNLPGAGQCFGSARLAENQTFDCVVPTGTYEVTEQDPAPNFALDQITCDDTDSTGDVGTRTATYVIDPAETVTCTFTNVDQRGHIVIEKAVSPPGAGDQFFTFDLPGAGQCIGTATLVESQTFDCVVPTGTYEVTEQDPAPNFALDQITCDDTDSTGDVGTRTATYVIDPAETVTCTFTNVDQRGHIVIEKAVSPPGAGDQFFTFNLPGAGQCFGTATLVENQTFDCVVPTGTYEVTEQDPAPNFALDQITCDDTDSTGDVGTRTATYVIDPAETVTCTFTNVDQRGHIVIEKAVSPPGAGDQFFTFNLPGAGQCIGTATLVENQTFDCVVPTGTYEVTEQDPAPNFALDQITCDDTDSTGDVGTRTATYVIDPAETVTCTFTNVDQRGHIVIEKAVSPPGAGDQFFTFNLPGAGQCIGTATLVESQTFDCVVPTGTYEVTEQDPAPNFALDQITCDDTDSTGDVGTRTATYVIDPAETVTCTFTNVDQRGHIVIEKAVSPPGAGDQFFTFNLPGAGQCFGTATLVENQTFDCVVPTGTYEVTEQDPAPNFALDQITCDDTDSTGDVGTRTATYVIDPAETVTCTFTNVDQRGHIVIEKAVSPPGAGDQFFTFNLPGAGQCFGTATLVENQTFDCVVPTGTYEVTEQDPAPNFALDQITCDDTDSTGDVGTRTATYVIDPAETVTCTFTNVDQRGHIVIEKAVSPPGAGDQFFTFNLPGAGQCFGTATLVENQTFDCVVPTGTYEVTEQDPAPNFALDQITCDDTDSTGDVGTRTATYVIDPAETVTCTFTNVDQRGHIVIEKAVSPPGAGDQFFTFNLPGAGQCFGSATLVENQTFDCVVPTGTYEVTEQDPAPNFALDQITCDDTDSTGDVGTRTATYVIDPAETVTCTFTNVDQRGHIVIEKAVSPPGAGDQFFTFNLPGAGQCFGSAMLVENQTFDCVVPTGTYEVTEQDPAPNFALDQITCDDTDSTGDVGTRTATYVIDPAETVTCTFTNVDQRGHIVIEKAVSPPGAGDQFFTFNLPGAGQCFGSAMLVENQTFDCVVPTGTYEVTEQDPAPNFALDQITCDDTDSTGDVGTRTATYVIDPAETVTCTFTNVDQRGHIVIEKAVSPPGAGDQFFTFNLPGAGQCFGSATLVENQTFDCVVPTGTYEVTEQDPAPNFALDQITCDDTDSTGDVGTRTATYVIDPAETVTCTFTNVDQRGHIVIEKAVSPPGAGDQFFTFNLPGAGQCFGSATLVENQTFDCVVPTGTYEVTEQDPAPNFALDQITCDDTDSTGDVGTRTATYVIDPAETVTCTFTNVDQRGHIVIEKAVSPPGAGDQFFTFNLPGAGQCFGSATLVENQTFDCVVPTGTYEVTEQDPAPNFALDQITCDDTDSTGDVGTRTATYVIDPAETVTCTFTNVDQRGHIVIEKAVSPPGAGDQFFTFNLPGAGQCFGSATLVENQTFDCVVPTGTYEVTEQDPAPNFALDQITCDDTDSTGDVGTRTATYVIDPAETVTCTFTNVDQRGHIVIEKAVSPPGAGDQFFTFNLPGAGQCFGSATLVENQTFDCVVPTGTYEVTEQDPAPNFALDQITCDDTDSTGDVGTRTATYVIDPAETVTCTFTNVDQRGHIVIEKAVSPPGAGDQFFTFNLPGAGQCFGSATLVENQTFDCVVPTGTYEVTEQDPAPNFALDQITCDDTDSTGDVGTRTATYVIDPAETVTCTFTNVDQR